MHSKDWSEFADGQADLSLLGARHIVVFVMLDPAHF